MLMGDKVRRLRFTVGYGNDCCILGPFVGDGSPISRPQRRR
jgi:hypothetical protein